MQPFQQVSSSNFYPARAARVNCKCCYREGEHLGATTAQLRSGKSHKLTERDRRALKHKNRLSSVATLTTEIQIASGSNISTITIRRELHEMGVLGRAAAHKPKINKDDTKHRLEWCKVHRH